MNAQSSRLFLLFSLLFVLFTINRTEQGNKLLHATALIRHVYLVVIWGVYFCFRPSSSRQQQRQQQRQQKQQQQKQQQHQQCTNGVSMLFLGGAS